MGVGWWMAIAGRCTVYSRTLYLPPVEVMEWVLLAITITIITITIVEMVPTVTRVGIDRQYINPQELPVENFLSHFHYMCASLKIWQI